MVRIIAVMFTFSFGSAFAAADVSGTFDKGLAKTYFDIAMDTLEVEGGIEIDGYYVDYATIEAQRADVFAAVLDFDKRVNAYVNEYGGIQAVLAVAPEGEEVALALVVAQYATDEAEVLAALSALNVADYSTEKIGASDLAALQAAGKYPAFNGETYQDFVQYLIGAATQDVKNANTMTADSAISAYVKALGTIEAFIAEAEEGYTTDGTKITVNDTAALVAEKAYIGTGNSVVGLGVYELNTVYTLLTGDTLGTFKATAVEDGKTNDAAAIAVVKAEIAQEYATYVTTAGRTAAEKEFAADMKLVLDTLADEGLTLGTIADYFSDTAHTPKTAFEKYASAVADAIKDVESVQAYADKMIAEKNEANATVRDAADVQDIADEYAIYAYAMAVGKTTAAADYNTNTTVKDAKAAMEKIYNDYTAEALAFEKKAVEKEVEELLAQFEYEETYYAPEFAKIKALADEYLAAVNALTEFKTNGSDNFLRLENKFTSAYGDVKTATQVNGLSGVSELIKVAKTYYGLYNDTLKGDNKLYDDSNSYAKLEKEVKALVGASDARTKAAILALGDQLAALVRTLPTIAQVEAAEEAAEDAVKALPATTVKISDRATIEAAKAALKEYKTLTTKTYNDGNKTAAAVTKLLYAYNNEFTAKAKVIDKTDKAAITALRSEIKQVAKDFATADYYEDYADEYTTTGNYVVSGVPYPAIFNTVYTTKLGGYLDDIQEAAGDAVAKAINAIPVNVTEAAAPAVQAARAAYDAYVADYTDYYNDLTVRYEARPNDGFVADDFEFAELLRAEAALGLNDKSEEIAKAAAIADIEGLKIKASSKAAKGAITVKWTVSEEVEGVKYQVYKSTKAQKGYKKSITTSKTSFKNTKNITKGTRYFYKVRAIGEVDGVTYYSDWSNKANRIAK